MAIGFIAADYVSSVIHIIVGLILLIVAQKPSAAGALKIFGIIYVILGILGLVGGEFMANDATTAWFYLIVGVVVAVLGFSSKNVKRGDFWIFFASDIGLYETASWYLGLV
jgi:predicted tellurium resistance membrane protein TerC